MIVIVDYGMGNLKSVANACRLLGKPAIITSSGNIINRAAKIIFPGVGHFGRAVLELKARRLSTVIKNKIAKGTPFLGICLGMQILFEASEEAPGCKGLGIIKGKVKRFSARTLAIPHMGWNQVALCAKRYALSNNNLFKGISTGSFFYFVHSYYCAPQDKNIVTTTTNYGIEFASSLNKENIWAVQFHAEKSQKLGLKVLGNFLVI